MMKRICAAALGLCLLLGLAACGGGTIDEGLKDLTCADICAANTGAALVESHGSFHVNTVCHNFEASELHEENYWCDGVTLSYDASDDFQQYSTALRGGLAYIHYYKMDPLVWGFFGDSYETEWNDVLSRVVCTETQYEEIVSATESEGQITVVTKYDYLTDDPSYYEAEYEISDGYIKNTYVLESGTLCALSVTRVHVGENGKETALNETTVEYGVPCQVPEELSYMMEPYSKRTVTVVFDPGKTSETAYRFEVAGNSLFGCETPKGYERYVDAAGKEIFNLYSDLTDDTIYMLPN